MNELELETLFLGAHAETSADAVAIPRRPLPRHRARSRPHWKPALEPAESAHAHHGDTFVP